MAGRIMGRLLWGLLVALFLLGALQLAANRLAPANDGLTDAPCPAPEPRLRHMARIAVLTLAGRRIETSDWDDLCIYQAENAAIAARGAWPRAVFMGDSITQYWGFDDPALFGANALGGDVLNRGVSGQNSAQVLVRLMPDALALRPKILHLMVGVNDVIGKRGPSRPEDYRNNIRAMVTLAQAQGIVVIIGLIPPANGDGSDDRARTVPRIRALNGWLAAFAAERGLVVADYYTPLAARDGSLRAAFSDDGLHPNHAGFARMAPVARAALAEADKRLAAEAGAVR
ncbi:GDSL family lipase [Novosphingobium flavum]|uniref:GDSL family lipase n=1 Tax=Novosphingobium flavum TaxID=1778672 RepID=A0A7X1FQE8_9SPHN|nr:GDSL-type esterase/lipase family protein [Novosphingobium flavum]MBC2665059.1 GDSL family lipase [Novosphingobium flavum]